MPIQYIHLPIQTKEIVLLFPPLKTSKKIHQRFHQVHETVEARHLFSTRISWSKELISFNQTEKEIEVESSSTKIREPSIAFRNNIQCHETDQSPIDCIERVAFGTRQYWDIIVSGGYFTEGRCCIVRMFREQLRIQSDLFDYILCIPKCIRSGPPNTFRKA